MWNATFIFIRNKCKHFILPLFDSIRRQLPSDFFFRRPKCLISRLYLCGVVCRLAFTNTQVQQKKKLHLVFQLHVLVCLIRSGYWLMLKETFVCIFYECERHFARKIDAQEYMEATVQVVGLAALKFSFVNCLFVVYSRRHMYTTPHVTFSVPNVCQCFIYTISALTCILTNTRQLTENDHKLRQRACAIKNKT